MGASASTNISDINQSFMTNITTINQSSCQATSSPYVSGNFIAVTGGVIKGDYTGIDSAANTDASCLIVSNMQNSVTSVLEASLSQNNNTETDWFNGFQFTADTNVFNMYQSTTNNINQINQTTCTANSAPNISNNYQYMANEKVGDDYVGVSSQANATANCAMTNTMKNNVYNQAQANANQSNVIKGMFVSMVGAFTTMIIIVVIAVVILFSIEAVAKVGYSKGGHTTQTSTHVPTLEEELAQLESLDLSSDVLAPSSEGSSLAIPPPVHTPHAPSTPVPHSASAHNSSSNTLSSLLSAASESDLGKHTSKQAQDVVSAFSQSLIAGFQSPKSK